MKIVHIANEVVSTGNGIVNSAVDLACLQSAAGHDVIFISSGGEYVDFLNQHGVRHHGVDLYFRSPLRLFRSLPSLKKLLAGLKPDIVHAHMMTAAVLVRLGRDLAGFGNYGIVTTVHNEWRLTSKLMQAGDKVIVLSNNGKKLYTKRGFPSNKLCVVRHGILQSPRRRLQIQNGPSASASTDAPVIVTMAGLYRRKGIGDLIRAFGQIAPEFPKASLHILGWGPDQTYFESLASSVEGSSRIQFKGFVAEPHSHLCEASVFVLASHTESFPLAVAEAREAGCAIVATTVGGVPELLEHGRAGILVPPHDPDCLAQALRSILSNQAELEKWRIAAQTNLDWLSCERMTNETIDVYRSLLRLRPSQRLRTS